MMGEKKLILPRYLKLGRHPLYLPPFSPVSLSEHLGLESAEEGSKNKVEVVTLEVAKPTTAEVLQYGHPA